MEPKKIKEVFQQQNVCIAWLQRIFHDIPSPYMIVESWIETGNHTVDLSPIQSELLKLKCQDSS